MDTGVVVFRCRLSDLVESEWYCTSARPARRGTVEVHVGRLDLIRVVRPYAHTSLHWIHGRANKSG